ncbi:hypothetical protein D3C75_1121480 [compost metagenome]
MVLTLITQFAAKRTQGIQRPALQLYRMKHRSAFDEGGLSGSEHLSQRSAAAVRDILKGIREEKEHIAHQIR